MVSLNEAFLSLGWGGIEGAARQFPLGKETENLPLGCPSNRPKYTKFLNGWNNAKQKKYEVPMGPCKGGLLAAFATWAQTPDLPANTVAPVLGDAPSQLINYLRFTLNLSKCWQKYIVQFQSGTNNATVDDKW